MNESGMESELSLRLAAIVILPERADDGTAWSSSRVDGMHVDALEARREAWHVTPGTTLAARIAGLRTMMEAAILREVEALTWTFSDVALDRHALIEALAGWTATQIPVHALIAFDFAARGDRDLASVTTLGLRAIVGQEIAAHPRIEAQRRDAARVVARLAHDLLTKGPMLQTGWFDGPGTLGQQVRLVPDRDGGWLNVMFEHA